jgi:hypothetical protein
MSNINTWSLEVTLHDKSTYDSNKSAENILKKYKRIMDRNDEAMTFFHSLQVKNKNPNYYRTLSPFFLNYYSNIYDMMLYFELPRERVTMNLNSDELINYIDEISLQDLKDQHDYEENEMNEIKQKYKLWIESGPVYSSVSMLVNGNDYLCSKVPPHKSDDVCRNAFWRMVWHKKTFGIVAMTTRAHYINYFPKIIGKYPSQKNNI